MLKTNHSPSRPNEMVKDCAEVPRSGTNVENFGTGFEEGEKVLCGVGMLTGVKGIETMNIMYIQVVEMRQTICGAEIVAS